jgi:hypothetical protein
VAKISGAGGYRFTIKPVLRDQKPIEQRWNRLAKERQAQEATSSRGNLRRFNPEWPGPVFVRSGPFYLRPLANAKFTCGEWRSRFSNDPAVDVAKISGAAAVLSFDKEGLLKVDAAAQGQAFRSGAFPGGLASEQASDTMTMPLTGIRHHGRSPALADVLDFNDLDQPSPSLSWQRIRREDGVTYTTKLFVRCKKQ